MIPAGAAVAVPQSRAVAPPRPAGAPGVRKARHVPGDQLLDVVRQWAGLYVRYPSAAALDLVTLWAAHTHVRDEAGVLVFRATPRLWFLSSAPGSGKSAALEELNMVCPETYGLSLEPSAPGLVKALKNRETVLLDEGDILLGKGRRKEAVRAIMNGGYTRNGTYPTARGREPVFGPVAMAGLDVLQKDTGDSLKALLSRGFTVRMRKAPREQRPAKMTRATEAQGARLSAWLAAWAAQERNAIRDAVPVMPAELDGRAEQISEPLVAVADAAGGDWPERARAACLELALAVSPAAEEDEPEIGTQLADFAASLGAGVVYDEAAEEDEAGVAAWDEGAELYEDGEGDAGVPLAPASPAYPPVTYRAVMTVRGRGTTVLASAIGDSATARQICERTSQAQALGVPLQWAQAAGGDVIAAGEPGRTVAWYVEAE